MAGSRSVSFLHSGQWRRSLLTADVSACPDAGQNGREVNLSACVGGQGNPCKANLTAVYCTSCVEKEGNFYSSEDRTCKPCGARWKMRCSKDFLRTPPMRTRGLFLFG